MASDPERRLATGLLCCLTCGWVVICITIVVMNLAIPGLPFLQEILVTMVSLTCFLCLSCRMLTLTVEEPGIQHVHSCRPPRREVWSSMKFLDFQAATEADTAAAPPGFHLIQFSEPSNPSHSPVKSVLRKVFIPAKPRMALQPTCACCLDDFSANDLVALLPCGHIFHEECVMKWFLTQASAAACPMCRACCTPRAQGP